MYTIAETEMFTKDADALWDDEERSEFYEWLAINPEVGRVIPGSGGCRKVRWHRENMGKRGGVRMIYYNRLENGKIWLLVIYAKSVRGDIPGHLIRQIKETLGDA